MNYGGLLSHDISIENTDSIPDAEHLRSAADIKRRTLGGVARKRAFLMRYERQEIVLRELSELPSSR